MNAKVFNALRKAEDVQFARAAAYVITKNGENEGKIQVAYPKDGAGILRVFVWDFEHEVQMGTAGGYGYDKLGAALHGIQFHDITLQDDGKGWEHQLREAGYSIIRAL